MSHHTYILCHIIIHTHQSSDDVMLSNFASYLLCHIIHTYYVTSSYIHINRVMMWCWVISRPCLFSAACFPFSCPCHIIIASRSRLLCHIITHTMSHHHTCPCLCFIASRSRLLCMHMSHHHTPMSHHHRVAFASIICPVFSISVFFCLYFGGIEKSRLAPCLWRWLAPCVWGWGAFVVRCLCF